MGFLALAICFASIMFCYAVCSFGDNIENSVRYYVDEYLNRNEEN